MKNHQRITEKKKRLRIKKDKPTSDEEEDNEKNEFTVGGLGKDTENKRISSEPLEKQK